MNDSPNTTEQELHEVAAELSEVIDMIEAVISQRVTSSYLDAGLERLKRRASAGMGRPAQEPLTSSAYKTVSGLRSGDYARPTVNEKGFPGPLPKDEFIGELAAFYRRCEVASLGELVEVSKRLPQLYPKYFSSGRTRTYAKSTYSRILKGATKGLPSGHFVTVFVLCCITLGRQRGVSSKDASTGQTVRYWQQRLRIAERRAEELGLFIRPGFHSPRHTAEAPRFRPEVLADAQTLPSYTLPEAVYQQLRFYLPYAQTIRDRLASGDAEAFYQAALLLAVHGDQEALAFWLLIRAAGGNHTQALQVLQESPQELSRYVVRQHADALAEEANHAGCHDAAEAFTECARRLEAFIWDEMPLAVRTPEPEASV